jgi:hypothetical protein
MCHGQLQILIAENAHSRLSNKEREKKDFYLVKLSYKMLRFSFDPSKTHGIWF